MTRLLSSLQWVVLFAKLFWQKFCAKLMAESTPILSSSRWTSCTETQHNSTHTSVFYWVNELMLGSKQPKCTGIEIYTLRAFVSWCLMLREKSYRKTSLSIHAGRESCDLGFFVAWSIVMLLKKWALTNNRSSNALRKNSCFALIRYSSVCLEVYLLMVPTQVLFSQITSFAWKVDISSLGNFNLDVPFLSMLGLG